MQIKHMRWLPASAHSHRLPRKKNSETKTSFINKIDLGHNMKLK